MASYSGMSHQDRAFVHGVYHADATLAGDDEDMNHPVVTRSLQGLPVDPIQQMAEQQGGFEGTPFLSSKIK